MTGERTMNLIFISSDQYPDGGAASNRHLAFAKGLVEHNNKVTFILLSNQYKTNLNQGKDGINFIPPPHFANRFKSRIIGKLISTCIAIRKGKKMIINLHSEGKVDAIILFDTYIWILYPFLNLGKKEKIKVFHERTEYPFIVERKGLLGKLHHRIYVSRILHRFDGIVVISNALKRYFIDITKDKVPVSILNMVVDPSRFDFRDISKKDNSRYIAYCGSMEPEKDGVDILIRAFGNAVSEISKPEDISLMLIGDNSNHILQSKLNQIIEESNCSGKIIFTGLITRQKIPEILINADALALARPQSKQAEGGFPTKLGEYLATGKPVIVTDVGEIGVFLKDGYNAFIARAGNINSFSEKIKQVFENYDAAAEIGLNGKKLVYNEFSYLDQAKKLIEFIEPIVFPDLSNK
jgi:glycosyltransferase involved in cell wall biosynthesis